MIGIVQPSLSAIGGSTRFTLDLIHLLRQAGYSTGTISVSKTNWNKLRFFLTPPTEIPDKEVYVLPREVPLFTAYQRVMMKYLVKVVNRMDGLTLNSCGTFIPIYNCDMIYVHGVTSWDIPLQKRARKLYYFPYMVMMKKFAEVKNDVYVVANSRYTAQRLGDINVKVDAVVYPPVSSIYAPARNGRKDQVVTVARLSESKNLDFIFGVAERLPNVRFIIVCAVSAGYRSFLHALLRKCKALKNVEIYANINYLERLELLWNSKIVLHMGRQEHFGLSLLESIVAGCIPIIYPEGGMLEIVQNLYHFKAKTVSDVVSAITKSLEKWTPDQSYSVSEAALKEFGYQSFSDQFLPVIEEFVR